MRIVLTILLAIIAAGAAGALEQPHERNITEIPEDLQVMLDTPRTFLPCQPRELHIILQDEEDDVAVYAAMWAAGPPVGTKVQTYHGDAVRDAPSGAIKAPERIAITPAWASSQICHPALANG